MTLRVAACQMTARLGDVAANLEHAEALLGEAFQRGAAWVVLPEFFPTGVGFHPALHDAALPLDGPAAALLASAARRHGACVGGSFIAERGGERYNTFVLARPDGSWCTHDKDIPTFWENCYYVGGSDPGRLEAGGLRVGAALCFEFLRTQTPRRLKDRVDLLVGGSGWWGMPRLPWLGRPEAVERLLRRAVKNCLPRMARMLGVPLVHAAHAGPLRCRTPFLPGVPYVSSFLGETQIVDAAGTILARLAERDGAGVITADVEPGPVPPSEPIPDGYWIYDTPWWFGAMWRVLNAHGRWHYRRHARRRAAPKKTLDS